jgi:hypothetical protein
LSPAPIAHRLSSADPTIAQSLITAPLPVLTLELHASKKESAWRLSLNTVQDQNAAKPIFMTGIHLLSQHMHVQLWHPRIRSTEHVTAAGTFISVRIGLHPAGYVGFF